MQKIWFITGASRGFGKEFARNALDRGDLVAATARDVHALDDLVQAYGDSVLPLSLDVTDPQAVGESVRAAHNRFGRLDVVVNNAGYGLFGAVEELSAQELRDQLEVNLFGVLHVTQAVLPILRAQGSGHIVQISSVGGVAAFPGLGGYHASKWALEGLTESLAQEVKAFGINVTLVEPGGYSTDWSGSSAVHAEPQPQYQGLRDAMATSRANTPPEMEGDPEAAGRAILTLVDAAEPPLRVFFGTVPAMLVPGIYQNRLATWEAWKELSIQAHGH